MKQNGKISSISGYLEITKRDTSAWQTVWFRGQNVDKPLLPGMFGRVFFLLFFSGLIFISGCSKESKEEKLYEITVITMDEISGNTVNPQVTLKKSRPCTATGLPEQGIKLSFYSSEPVEIFISSQGYCEQPFLINRQENRLMIKLKKCSQKQK